ncbi:hypothetical protein SB717_35700, partial [Priestia sp. SIMBA_032]
MLAAAAAVALALTGCTGAPAPTASATVVASPTPAPTSTTPAAIALVPGGTATQNLPYFDQVNHATLAKNPNAQGRDFIDGLV